MRELEQVRRAARSKRRADEVFRASLRAAVDAGCSYSELARELGVSRQAVRQLAQRLRS